MDAIQTVTQDSFQQILLVFISWKRSVCVERGSEDPLLAQLIKVIENAIPIQLTFLELRFKTVIGFSLSRPYLANGKDEDLHFLFLFYSSPCSGGAYQRILWRARTPDTYPLPCHGKHPLRKRSHDVWLFFFLSALETIFFFFPLLVAAEIILPEGGDVLNRRPMLRYACYQTGNDVTVAAAPSGAAASRR
ncbi:hypothetical protein NPIL_297671 [Nephila pilipes]|uniref:Uncharacterized protein n=1 Tax=Nephila pilipes TaxID=299642 RepID=A0A8X6M797_NEPPI|nr:hypothetical protein NPIL_297671 [Nephila pilipes]